MAEPHQLRTRAFGLELQHSWSCGSRELKSIAAIVDRPAIEKIVAHVGLDPQSPCAGLAREGGKTEAA